MDPTRRVRIAIFCIVFALCAVGVVMIYSASAVYADQRYGDGMYFLKRHLVSLTLGFLAGFLAMLIDYRELRKFVKPVLAVVGVGLVAVLIPTFAHKAGGAHRWFPVMGFHIQPSEFAKLAVILFLSDALARREPAEVHEWKRTLVPLGAVCGTLVGLILLEPDLGTSAALGAIFLLLLFAGGLKGRYFLWLFGAAAAGFAAAIFAVPYRMRRVLSFLRPWEDPQGAGFQLWQSFLALGSGGILGVGLGRSRQKLFYLPEAHNDFVFSIIGEELGFVGAGAVILLFAAFVFFGFLVVTRCQNRFGQLLSLGLVSLIAMEAAINIGVSIGALPTKGLPLPFISYGGSSVIVKLLCVGLLLNISRDARTPAAARPEGGTHAAV